MAETFEVNISIVREITTREPLNGGPFKDATREDRVVIEVANPSKDQMARILALMGELSVVPDDV